MRGHFRRGGIGFGGVAQGKIIFGKQTSSTNLKAFRERERPFLRVAAARSPKFGLVHCWKATRGAGGFVVFALSVALFLISFGYPTGADCLSGRVGAFARDSVIFRLCCAGVRDKEGS